MALALFALASVASYAGQRLASHAWGETDPRLILAQEHIPYRWRVGMSVLHGLVVAAMAWPLVRDPGRWLAVLPWLTLLTVATAAAAMVAVP